jgi:acetyl-CoA carboxylase alpha subunit
VEIARHRDRPRTRDYIHYLIDGFEELKGDRLRAEDPAIVGGIGWFNGRAVLVVGHQKGRTLDEQTVHNFGMASPEGYRKAQRLFTLAERHRLAVLTFVLSITSSLSSWEAVGRSASAACGAKAASRQSMAAQPSGEMTE